MTIDVGLTDAGEVVLRFDCDVRTERVIDAETAMRLAGRLIYFAGAIRTDASYVLTDAGRAALAQVPA